MRAAASPIVRDLVLVGGGHAHVQVLKRFGMKPMDGVRITLIARDIDTPYSGMLPGFIAGHYSFDDVHIDLAPLAAFAAARLIHAEATGIDRTAKLVRCGDRPPVPYDVLSIDIGSRPKVNDVPGAAAHTTPVKPIDRFAARWTALIGRVAARAGPFSIGVVGGGAGGVEVLLAMQHRLRQLDREAGRDPDRLSFHLVTAAGLLPTHPAKVAAIFERVLRERGVHVELNAPVAQVEPGRIVLRDGRTIALDEILWTTQAGAAPWLRESGFACDEDGFIKVRPTLQALDDDTVFAAGDVAAVVEHSRPKAGVFAVRQGPPLTENLRRVLAGEAARPFTPQRRFLSLISTGDRYAVASRGGWAAEGAWLWRWKDRIDRRFMERFQKLPEMTPPAPALASGRGLDPELAAAVAAGAMRCGGCGAKIGATVLSRALGRLADQPSRSDVVIGLDAPDDAAVVRVPPGMVAVQSVDFFRDFIGEPFLFGRIAANHALGDLYAMGATPQSALAIATVPFAAEAKVEEALYQLLAGARRTLDAADCALVGGHSAEAAELGLGFAVNGVAAEGTLLRKSGMRPGDTLILTKAIGTGVLFAAAMRGRARGRWLDAATAAMLVSQRDAARILRASGATAMTDVTGFGLLGHLVEMAKASGVDAAIDPAAVPVLAGARECVAAGLSSSLQPANLRLVRSVIGAGAGDVATLNLLVDPQTAGGLLAAVPADKVRAAITALQAAGHGEAAAIGRAVDRSGRDLSIALSVGA